MKNPNKYRRLAVGAATASLLGLLACSPEKDPNPDITTAAPPAPTEACTKQAEYLKVVEASTESVTLENTGPCFSVYKYGSSNVVVAYIQGGERFTVTCYTRPVAGDQPAGGQLFLGPEVSLSQVEALRNCPKP